MTKARRLWTVLLASLLISFACAAYPMYVIRPFRHQGVHELAVALAVLQWRSLVTAACVVLALAALILYWRSGTRILARTGAAFSVLVVALCTYLCHVNVYELMFHPMGAPKSAPLSQTKLDGGEEVLAVELNGAARAYPVRILSYHHIANDTLGGVPIAATY